MEMTLEVVSFQKSLMGDSRTHTFDETGGSIGRARENSWVLPDPNRYVSAHHADIAWANGRFRIVDKSTNGVFVNDSGAALGRDAQVDLSNGDRIVIGDYEIAVRLQERAATSAPTAARPAPIPGFERPPPKDILEVVDQRRAEPRLKPLIIPEDSLDAEDAPGRQRHIPDFRPAPRSAPPQVTVPPIAKAVPTPVRPPLPIAPAAAPPASPPPAIPEDADFAPVPAAPKPIPAPAPPAAARQMPPATPQLPDDFDDLLPAPRPAGPAARQPVTPLPEPEPVRASTPPMAAVPAEPLPESAPRQVAPPLASPEPAPPRIPAGAEILPPGIRLLKPVPGTGNSQEPLSPPSTVPPVGRSDPAPAVSQSSLDDPAIAPAQPGDGGIGSEALVAALAGGLGVDRETLGGLDPAATVALVGRAARAAALGIGGAFDARNAFARSAGVDLQALDQESDNPFLTYRSGEAALREALKGTGGGGQALDAATRSSIVALTANALAAAAALDALLDRMDSDDPPRSAEAVREFFGAVFANAYHRESGRLK